MKYCDYNNAMQLENPDFEHTEKVHDWRNHVGHNVQGIWHSFTVTQKLAIAKDADEMASREVWD